MRVRSGAPGRNSATPLARGSGWSIDDVLCTFGPEDRSFPEQHAGVTAAIVVAGTFQYRTDAGLTLMTPGAVLLGTRGQRFQCGHDHAAGDRCVAFRFDASWFEQVASDAGATRLGRRFQAAWLEPKTATAGIVAEASVGLLDPGYIDWDEIATRVAACVAVLANGRSSAARARPASHRALARATESVREIERNPGAPWTLRRLAADAGLSPFHYLRIFKSAAGVTPYHFVRRARLRASAVQLAVSGRRVSDVALAAGFGDLSTFNHAFRSEFGMPPLAYRRRITGRRQP